MADPTRTMLSISQPPGWMDDRTLLLLAGILALSIQVMLGRRLLRPATMTDRLRMTAAEILTPDRGVAARRRRMSRHSAIRWATSLTRRLHR